MAYVAARNGHKKNWVDLVSIWQSRDRRLDVGMMGVVSLFSVPTAVFWTMHQLCAMPSQMENGAVGSKGFWDWGLGQCSAQYQSGYLGEA